MTARAGGARERLTFCYANLQLLAMFAHAPTEYYNTFIKRHIIVHVNGNAADTSLAGTPAILPSLDFNWTSLFLRDRHNLPLSMIAARLAPESHIKPQSIL